MVLLQFAATWPLPRVPQKHFPASRYKYYHAVQHCATNQQSQNSGFTIGSAGPNIHTTASQNSAGAPTPLPPDPGNGNRNGNVNPNIHQLERPTAPMRPAVVELTRSEENSDAADHAASNAIGASSEWCHNLHAAAAA